MNTEDIETDPEPKIVVDDPEDLAKTRQLRAIFDARDEYTKTRRKANEKLEHHEITRTTRNYRLFRTVQDFIMAIEPLLKSHDQGKDLWKNRTYRIEGYALAEDVSSVEVAKAKAKKAKCEIEDADLAVVDSPLVAALQDLNGGEGNRRLGRKSKQKSKLQIAATEFTVEFEGLSDILGEIPDLRRPEVATKGEIERARPPQHLSDEVFRDCQAFIDQVGLGIEVEEEQHTKIDDDLLEELDQWRQEHTS